MGSLTNQYGHVGYGIVKITPVFPLHLSDSIDELYHSNSSDDLPGVTGFEGDELGGNGEVNKFTGSVRTAAWFHCDQIILSSCTDKGGVRLWDTRTGPAHGTRATTCTPVQLRMRLMLQSTDVLLLNFVFSGKGNTAKLGGLHEIIRATTANVIVGLALGYKYVIVPIFSIAIVLCVSFSLAAMYGVAVAALAMLNTISTGLAIDAYGPMSDNAGGIAEMVRMSQTIRARTDALNAARNTTATIGAMLPYWFSTITIKSGGSAALKMVEEVRRQFNTIPGLMKGNVKPDYATCVKISAGTALEEMIPPSARVILSPLIAGTFFGMETLASALVSLMQVAISVSITDGAWGNAKKYTEAGASNHAKSLDPKSSDTHKAAAIGDTLLQWFLVSKVRVSSGIVIVTFVAWPSKFAVFDFGNEKVVINWHHFFSVSIGLWAGLTIGYTNEYYTSNAYIPVQDVADSCRAGDLEKGENKSATVVLIHWFHSTPKNVTWRIRAKSVSIIQPSILGDKDPLKKGAIVTRVLWKEPLAKLLGG